MRTTIIKIGGSVLTKKKSSRPVFLGSIAAQLAKELKRYGNHARERFLIVHGVGSFAHPLAKKYNIHAPHSRKSVKGALETHRGAKSLNAKFAHILLKAGCPVIPLSPFSLARQTRGNIQTFETGLLGPLMDKGFIPLLHGDVVRDSHWKFSVCSGDQIAAYLANKFPVQRVLFATDVDGIATEDPKTAKNPRFFKILKKKHIAKLWAKSKSSPFDVTGAMGGKTKEIAKIPCPVRVFNGLKKGNFFAVLQGKKLGTLVA